MFFPEEITRTEENIEKIIEYLISVNFLHTEEEITSFRNHLHALSDEEFARFVNELMHFNK
jgi:hypothetical protein